MAGLTWKNRSTLKWYNWYNKKFTSVNALCYNYFTHFCLVCSKNKECFEAIFISATVKKTKKLHAKEFNGDILLTCEGCVGTWVARVGTWVLWVKRLGGSSESGGL